MATPQKLWHTGPKRTLWTEANGLRLSIELSATPGLFRFTVAGDVVAGDAVAAATPSRPLATGNRRSAMDAMAAAEQAADSIAQRALPAIPLTAISGLAAAEAGPEPAPYRPRTIDGAGAGITAGSG